MFTLHNSVIIPLFSVPIYASLSELYQIKPTHRPGEQTGLFSWLYNQTIPELYYFWEKKLSCHCDFVKYISFKCQE